MAAKGGVVPLDSYDAGGIQNLEGWRSVKKFGDPWAVVDDLGSPGIFLPKKMDVSHYGKNLPFSMGDTDIMICPSSFMVY